MKSENKYIGDDKFIKFLQHYSCPASLELVKMRFAGAICSPNPDLRPTDVISSFWPDNLTPRLETKAEADLFFKFFMGLWDEMFERVCTNNLELPRISPQDDLANMCQKRREIIEFGFLEGFFGGLENIKIPAFIAEIADSLSSLGELYAKLGQKIASGKERQKIFDAILECDKTALKSMSFIIEHYALPHINDLRRTIN